MYNLKNTLNNLHLPKRTGTITVAQAQSPGASTGAGAAHRPLPKTGTSRTSNLIPAVVHPMAFSSDLNSGAPQPQPASGEILPNPAFIPSESRDPINNTANPHTPHGKTGRLATVRV